MPCPCHKMTKHTDKQNSNNELHKSIESSTSGYTQQQVPLLPEHAGHNHRCCRRYHNDGHRTRLKGKREGRTEQDGHQPAHHTPRCRTPLCRCTPRPCQHADTEGRGRGGHQERGYADNIRLCRSERKRTGHLWQQEHHGHALWRKSRLSGNKEVGTVRG